MLIRQEKALTSLKRAADQCRRNCGTYTTSIVGVVVDMTRPLYRERDKDFIIELKIVDEYINENNIYGILVKNCSVYVFSRQRRQLQIINQIGQIVYLQSFTFTLWNDIKLEAKYLAAIERLYTFDVEGDRVKVLRKLISTLEVQELGQEVMQRTVNLKKWFMQHHFDKLKFSLGINLINNFCVMAEPFNMILKVQIQKNGIILENKSGFELKLYLADSNNNSFFIDKNYLPLDLPRSRYIYVRGIKYIGNFYEINLTPTGYILGLPEQFEELYQKQMNYCAISRFNQKFLLKNHKACNLSKINYVSPKTTPISELLTNMELYQNKYSQKQELRVEDLYMIEAVAINFQGKLLMFHTEHQMITHDEFINNLTEDEKKQLLEEGKLAYLYQGVLGVIDRSSEHTGRLLYVHLFSNELRTRFFDSEIIEELNKNAGSITNKHLEQIVKEKIQQKLRNLITKSDFTNTISMLLQPIKSDVLIYRLTNTIFV